MVLIAPRPEVVPDCLPAHVIKRRLTPPRRRQRAVGRQGPGGYSDEPPF